jgi:ribosome-associated protein
MVNRCPDIDELSSELQFTTSKSGGPGGQNVNKVNTKVTLRWEVSKSPILSNEQRLVILDKLKNVINNDGEVVISAHSSRSQITNKQEAINKLAELLNRAFKYVKPRKPTKPTKASNRRRLDNKKKLGAKKKQRRDLDP